MYSKKSFLVLRILEKKLGKELLLQVMNKLLSVCAHSVQQRLTPSVWQTGILLSTDSFLKCVSNVTGHDLQSFIDQWVKQGGHAEFIINFNFNRKRNSVELDIKQDLSGVGSSRYIGPLSVTIQELDGSFTYTIQIDDVSCRHDIQCHSKARRQRKRRIPLWTGEEVDMDLTNLDPDSPLLWIRFDPELLTLSRIVCHQPDYQWQYQLKHERDVVAQLQALRILPRYPTPQTRLSLIETIRNEQCFYRVRCESCFALADVANRLFSMMAGIPSIVTVFNSIFGSKSSNEIPRLNNFSNFQQYFLAKALISSAALIRTTTTAGSSSSSDYRCPPEVHQFLMSVCKLNNNSQNKFADDLYRSNIYEAFGKTMLKLRRSDHSAISTRRNDPEIDMRVQNIVQELVHALNMEKIKPSYGKCISSACLRALTDVWKSGYINEMQSVDDNQDDLYSNFLLWWNFVENEPFLPARLIALECIIDYLLCCKRVDFFDLQSGKIKSPCFFKFIDFLDKEEENFQLYLRIYSFHYLLCRMTFDNKNRSTFVDSTGLIFRTKSFFDRCSRILTENISYSSLTKSLLLDLMLILFGKDEPCFTTDGFVVGCTDMEKEGVGSGGNVIREDAGFSLASDDLILTPVTL
uniref:Uncharacterized protein n=1 Tax=Romanomermis culicivorax TaxID=13658 RepID=A0A915KXA1_ROMCU